jgi:cytochrome P450
MVEAARRAEPPDGALPIPRVRRLDGLARLRHFRMRARSLTQRLHDRYGNVCMDQIGPVRTVHLFGPDANRMVVLDRDGNLSSKRAWTWIMGRIFPNGLLLRDGAEHRQHRAIMQPAFRKPALRAYAERMDAEAAAHLERWRGAGGRLLAYPAFKDLTLDLACRIFVGIEPGPAARRLGRAFEDAVAASMSLLRLPIPGLEFARGLAGRRWMKRYFESMIGERRAKRGDDMLSRLCHAEDEGGERFSDDEIADHMIFLMMAAHDTTTSTLTSLVYELARHPDWQERVRAECAALGRPELAYDDLPRLEALGLCLAETLRRYPPLSTIPRVSLRAFAWEGYEIPADTLIATYPIHTHHMPEWWSAPFRFDPERFAAGREEHLRHTHSYLPFGGGAHMCLGRRFAELQIRIVIFHLVRRYRFRVSPGYEMVVQEAPISKPVDGLPLELEAIA